jgi:hypothetical protein
MTHTGDTHVRPPQHGSIAASQHGSTEPHRSIAAWSPIAARQHGALSQHGSTEPYRSIAAWSPIAAWQHATLIRSMEPFRSMAAWSPIAAWNPHILGVWLPASACADHRNGRGWIGPI